MESVRNAAFKRLGAYGPVRTKCHGFGFVRTEPFFAQFTRIFESLFLEFVDDGLGLDRHMFFIEVIAPLDFMDNVIK